MTGTSGVGGSSGSGTSDNAASVDHSDDDSQSTTSESIASEPTTSESLSGIGSHDAAARSGFSGNPQGQEPTTTESLASEPTTTDSLATTPTSTDGLLGTVSSDTDPVAASPSLTGLVDQATNVGIGITSANVNLNGLAIGSTTVVDSMKFGRFAPNSVTPNRGYSLPTFTQPGSAPYYSMNTMVSSQASWQNARALDPTLANTRFEVASPLADTDRTYDRAFNNTYFEDKAGKSINARQLATDVDLARTGQPVNYAFSGNPVTGNHGPDARGAAALESARVRSGGNLTSVVSDVAVSPHTVTTVKSASYTSVALRGASRLAGPAAAVMDGYNIVSTAREHGVVSTETAAVVTETAGAWAGAAGGGLAGAKGGAVAGAMVGGPAGAAVGAVVGGVVGAVGGAIAGSSLGKTISGWFGW
ncbi:MAG: hypothetical protein AB8B87_18240 [Granulosicoccus sp.]